MRGPVRLVVADDQALIREGLARILGPDDGFELVAAVGSGEEVVALVETAAVDLVLMDLQMPGIGGVEAIRLLRTMPESPPVLVVTTFGEEDTVLDAVAAGANGYVLKDATAAVVIDAARAVASGAAWFDADVAPALLAASRSGQFGRARPRARHCSPTGRTTSCSSSPPVRPTPRSPVSCIWARAP